MNPHKPNHIVASICAMVAFLPASGTISAQLISNPQTAKHYSANSFVSSSAEIGARFGYALAVGDFNDDGFDDLAIGVPYQSYQGDYDRRGGAVMVAYGAWDGLNDDNALPAPGIMLYGGIGGPPQHLERFGWSLAVGDFDGGGYDDLAVGAPGFDISASSEGAVYTFSGGSVGLSTLADIRWTQAVLVGFADNSEQFGHSLAAGDIDGDGRDDLAIGIPWDRVNSVAQGSVAVLYANAGGLAVPDNQLWNQESPGVYGVGESGDLFGWSLAIGDINLSLPLDLLIGSPGESVGNLAQAGAATFLFGTNAGLDTNSGSGQGSGNSVILTQDWFGDASEPSEAGDRFGDSVYISMHRWLHIGASGEDKGYYERGLLQTIEADYPDPFRGAEGQNRYGGPAGTLGSSGMASGALYFIPAYAQLQNVLISGEPGFMNGRGAVRIALNGWLAENQATGGSYFSNAFGLVPQENAHFGKSAAVGNFNGRGAPEIVIGAPLWDVIVPFNPPISLPDRGQITVVDDSLFADGFD